MKMIDEALRYAKAGIPVFPLHWLKQDGTCSCRLGDMCQAKGKHPRIKNWSDEATTDVAKITGWWNQTPLANIGIPMGEKSGLVALDVDTRHDGDKSLTDLVTEYGALPKTITATTGSGGKHYIFKYTEELALKNVVGFRDGLDVRTQGGLIVAAPSMHQSGNRYAWDSGLSPFECEAAEMPSWLVDEIRKVGTKLIARLKGARFVTAIEMEENKRLAESLIKSMTGGDKLVTRFLYGEYFEYVPQFKVFLAANHKPIIRDTTHSIWRRIKLMPFENTFTEANRDKHFADKIMAKEMPGILAWAVKGCLLWQREGIQDPPSVKRATTEYRTEMDSFATFFEECCEAREGVRVSNKMLRSSYDEWCKDNGEYALSQRPFSQKLLEMGFEKKRSASTGAVEWIGLSIRGVASRL